MIGHLPPRPTGSSPSARFFQWIWDTLASQQVTVRQAPGARVSRTTRGTIVEPSASGGTGPGAETRKLILADASNPDYLICRPWNEDYWTVRRDLRNTLLGEPTAAEIAAEMEITEEELTAYLAEEVIVAKSPELRQGDFENLTVDLPVEEWDGATVTTDNKTLTFTYHTSTLRTVEDEDSSTELQTVIPRFRPEDTIIHALSTRQSEMEVDAASVTLIDMNLDARAWLKTTQI